VPETVLVVDDEDIVREVITEMLQDAGYVTVEARHGAEALERLSTYRVDLVLSDVSMPVMDGYGLYDRIRAGWAGLPFIFLTAHGERARLRHAKELGVDDYLVKPVGSEDLVVAVRALLARHARIEAGRDAQIGQLKEAILMAVAHELRTPLTYLSGYAELLGQSPAVEAGRLRTLVEGILKGTRRLQRLAEDLVFLVDLRSGEAFRGFEREKRPLPDLPSLLHAAVAARQASADAAGVSLAAELPAQLPAPVGHDRLLGNALDRLLDNAVKFSKPGGRVTLRARAQDGDVVIEVEDQGPGIPAPELARVCELFHQVDRKRQEQQGVGSGLAVAHTIALMHGGTLSAVSQVGVGSTFTLCLPAQGVSGAS
jgi:signal transduction histidine kinase